MFWKRAHCLLPLTLLLCCMPAFLLSAQASEPTSAYKPRDMEGFTVLVAPELEQHAEEAKSTFEELTMQLKAINTVVPDKPLQALHQVKIWLEWENRKDGAAEFHPSAQWLREHGYNPDKAGCVEISNAVHFVKWSRKEQPWMLLHEMAHAYRFLVLGDRFTGVEAAYHQAMQAHLYDAVAYVHGNEKRKAYATTNAEEYFAELSEAYFGKNDFYPFTRLDLAQHDPSGYRLMVKAWGDPKANPPSGATTDSANVPEKQTLYSVTRPPQALVDSLKLKPFYRKYVNDRGFPVLSSEKVSDYALLEAAYLIDHLLAGRDDIRAALIHGKVRFVVMAPTEMTTAVPEYSDLTPSRYWDRRARGLGATPERPAVSCGEENLLGYPGDPYKAENILIHEFSHAIHEMGLRVIDADFDRKLKHAYDHAMQQGLYKGFYAATNPSEYWAEGVQSWFDCNHNQSAFHEVIATREKLQAHDPELAALIASVFPVSNWRYQRPEQRPASEKAHLRGYDPTTAPHFAWDPALVAWYQNYEAEQQKKHTHKPQASKHL